MGTVKSSKSSIVLATTVLLLVGGCSHKGFNRDELRQQVGVAVPVYDNPDVKDEFDKKANLPKPFRLAVYFKPPRQGAGQPKWRWTDEDKTLISAVSQELKAQGVVSDVFLIVNSLVQRDELLAIRVAAAKHHADAVLIVSGGAQVDHYMAHRGI